MSIIHSQKEKYGNGSSHLGINATEGTSARTRPFSFEQIMTRRRNKKLIEDAKGKAFLPKMISEKDDSENAPGHKGPDGGVNLRKDSKHITGSSKSKEEIGSTKKRSPSKHKDKTFVDLDANLKVRSTRDENSQDKEFKKEKQSHNRSRTDDRSKRESGKDSSRKRYKDAKIKDKYEGEDRKSVRENKRKNLTGHDEKYGRQTYGFTPKKHGSGKRQDLEPLERRRSQRYEEQNSKRRRSKSWEYERGRDRESISLSPRMHKRSFHGRDHGESSSHSIKDRPRRQYSDADKYRSSGNGGYESGRYRGHGSGLGGYSPRKRRTEAAVSKIPSPTSRSPDRKGATWDLPPSGMNHSTYASTPGNLQLPTQNVHDQQPSIPDTTTSVKSQWTPSSSAAPAISFASIDSVHLTQATRPMRRLYIENLPASATDKSIIGCLNDFLQSTGTNYIPGTEPCISCIINKEKCQAVVEFITPEDATAALSFDGKSFSGSTLKLRRPKDFIDATTTGVPEKPAAVVNALADVVKDSPHKIFIGGVSDFLSSDMLLEIVSVFGLVKAYHFEFSLELNQPCAFVEYVDQSITQKVCAGLNGIKLGGSVLTVVRAFPDAHSGEENLEKPPSYEVPEHARPLLDNPTQVLRLKNVFDQDNFLQLSEPELEEILEDIRLECARSSCHSCSESDEHVFERAHINIPHYWCRFGTVKSVNVVRYMSSDNMTTEVEQDLMDESGKVEPREDTLGHDVNQNSEQMPLDNAKKSPVIEEVSRSTEAVDDVDEDLENEDSSDSSQPTADVTWEEPPEPEVAGEEQNRDDAVVKLEEGQDGDGSMVTEDPNQGQVDTELGKTSIELEPEVWEKSDANFEDGSQGVADQVFEPGCVFVEFLRKEATCTAAHCLNGRLYDGRVVLASYATHDIYLARFPR